MITYRHLGRNGQLGNQLWQIAGTVGIAHKEGDMAGFPFWRYRRYFSVPAEMFSDLDLRLQGRDLGLDYLQDLRNFEDIEERRADLLQAVARCLDASGGPIRRNLVAPAQDVTPCAKG